MRDEALMRTLVGRSPIMERLRRTIAQVAGTDLPTLIQGPTGSGKELVAEGLHRLSGRSGPFVTFNVCAISDSMFEDALFGHEEGAYTGASRTMRGYLEEAHGGTLFLDEIGSLSPENQPKLLRAVETGRFRPLGATADRASDFRVVSASNEDLGLLIAEGRFRADLFHRLGGILIHVPPLSDRAEDIPELVRYFLNGNGSRSTPVSVSSRALRLLQEHHWPGNVRELRHVVQRAALLATNGTLGAEEFGTALAPGHQPSPPCLHGGRRQELLALLDACNWNTAEVAAGLGIHRATVYRRMQRLGIRREKAKLVSAVPA